MVDPTDSSRQPLHLPMFREEMNALGWGELDILLVTGDAYVDHPSFGAALLGRKLVEEGFRVGIVAQPRWDGVEEISRLGRPRLFCGVTSGAVDSMVAHYTAFRKKRRDDRYTPGGRAGARPNRASIVYSGLVRRAFPGLAVVLGGIEASLRRTAHFDFWTNKIRKPLLLDAKADLLVYGMGELALLEVTRRLARFRERSHRDPPRRRMGGTPECLVGIPGTVTVGAREDGPPASSGANLPSHGEVAADAAALMEATLLQERRVHGGDGPLTQDVGGGRWIVVWPPQRPMTTRELDQLYRLPFTGEQHPSYREPVPALEMIQSSVTTHRGCGGGCTFCSLALHQGRRIASRSADSIVAEVERMTGQGRWGGAVTDVGGPSANMWGAECKRKGECSRRSCLHPSPCRDLVDRQGELADLLRRVASLPEVRHVRVASGVRHDLALRSPKYMNALVREFVGGQLKLAPEHLSESVLRLMRKPGREPFEGFLAEFERRSAAAGREQYLVPYLMSAFPGCTDEDMEELARWLRRRGWRPRQVQCFLPTPGTVATAMYHGEIDPSGRKIPVPKTDQARQGQHRLLLGRG